MQLVHFDRGVFEDKLVDIVAQLCWQAQERRILLMLLGASVTVHFISLAVHHLRGNGRVRKMAVGMLMAVAVVMAVVALAAVTVSRLRKIRFEISEVKT